MSGGLILFWSDAGLRLCVLFLGEAVVCCVDGLDCGGGVCVSGGLILFWSDAELRLCELFLGIH